MCQVPTGQWSATQWTWWLFRKRPMNEVIGIWANPSLCVSKNPFDSISTNQGRVCRKTFQEIGANLIFTPFLHFYQKHLFFHHQRMSWLVLLRSSHLSNGGSPRWYPINTDPTSIPKEKRWFEKVNRWLHQKFLIWRKVFVFQRLMDFCKANLDEFFLCFSYFYFDPKIWDSRYLQPLDSTQWTRMPCGNTLWQQFFQLSTSWFEVTLKLILGDALDKRHSAWFRRKKSGSLSDLLFSPI